MSRRIYFMFMLLVVWSEMVTSQLAGITTAESSSSIISNNSSSINSSLPLSAFETTTGQISNSGEASSAHDESSSSTSPTTLSQGSSTESTIPHVQPEADSSGVGHASSSLHSSRTPPATETSTIAQSFSVSTGSSLGHADATVLSSEETTTAGRVEEGTTSLENQSMETTTTSESTVESTGPAVTETTSDIASATLTTEFSTVTEIDSTAFEITTELESTAYSTTVVSVNINTISQEGTSVMTEKSATSTESSSAEPLATDSANDSPTPEGKRASCYGQAEVNTAMIVAIVVSVNVITIAVTAFCVHRLVSRRLSWDPPPMNFSKQRTAVSLPHPAPRTGIDLATDSECRAGESPATQIPIVITNEDGWCVPYSEQDQKKANTANGTEDTGV